MRFDVCAFNELKNKKKQKLAQKISYKLFDKQKHNGLQRCGVTRAHLNFSSCIHLILLVYIAIYYLFFAPFIKNKNYKIVDLRKIPCTD